MSSRISSLLLLTAVHISLAQLYADDHSSVFSSQQMEANLYVEFPIPIGTSLAFSGGFGSIQGGTRIGPGTGEGLPEPALELGDTLMVPISYDPEKHAVKQITVRYLNETSNDLPCLGIARSDYPFRVGPLFPTRDGTPIHDDFYVATFKAKNPNKLVVVLFVAELEDGRSLATRITVPIAEEGRSQ